MRVKKAYVDIEATYCGDIDPEKSGEDKERFFKDFVNWKFVAEKNYGGKKVEYNGMIGILLLEFELYQNKYKIMDKKFTQLIGQDITKERLMKELEGVNEIIGYHCRTKPGPKGRIGYDFGVVAAQLDVTLDNLPGVNCLDLELLCHTAEMYGGLKSVEMQVPTVPIRRSGIMDGLEAEKLIFEAASCEDIEQKKDLIKKVRRYNREDVVNMVFIEHYLRNLKIVD